MMLDKDRMSDLVVGNMTLTLGNHSKKVRERIEIYSKTGIVGRIWRKDKTAWFSEREVKELTDRLGWLEAPFIMRKEVTELKDFALEVKKENYKDIVILGMGGSSLAPYVFMSVFGAAGGYPKLTVLDSTHPLQVKHVLDQIDPSRTLFLVSSKSGTTLETDSLLKFFWEEVYSKTKEPGKNFVAITDPGTPLENIALDKKFRKIFSGFPDVGGRYSALTYFGLVPAALIGLDIDKLLERALSFAQSTKNPHPLMENQAILLGVTLGELMLTGRDKLNLFISRPLVSFGAWVEQLIAESTGKAARGILPVVDELSGRPVTSEKDSVFVYLKLKGDEIMDPEIQKMKAAGHPTIEIDLKDEYDLGAEFFKWEMATAVVGAVIGVNPFDQPDVESTKKKTKEVMKTYSETSRLPEKKPLIDLDSMSVYGEAQKGDKKTVSDFLVGSCRQGYVAIMAYLPPCPDLQKSLEEIRSRVNKKTKLATTLGFGPRFLHSTGQLHKGDANRGSFMQITCYTADDLNIPGEKYTFGTLISAQALGDYMALLDKNRRVIRIHIKGDMKKGLKELEKVL